MKLIARRILFCVLIACCCASASAADVYPSRTVKLLVPQAPGGATDVFARKLAQLLTARWKQPVIVENRAGAAGVIGTEAVGAMHAGKPETIKRRARKKTTRVARR